ncbi:unnamed protein product [Cylicocyclus nassatus]|uniref:DUF1758 domain-containing protein n=1 Tax=Cylicocyclus nassatus TaxID=53992 RepID=A0AA36GMX1_CYLNA|nr:unnamed protein product [Cylicocyclus nassatus]
MSCNDNQPISIDELANSSATVPEEKGNNSTFTTTEATNQPAPLMCTDVKLFNPDDPSCCATATAFLDCGSTATYITEELAALLNFPTIKREELNVSTFAGSKPMLMECSIHKIGIVTENGTKCLIVKSTTSLAKDVMQIIPDGNLSVTLCKPSILIGNDYFWDLVLSHNFCYKNLSEGHSLLHTTIGDIILKKALDTKFKHCSFVSIENDDVANPANHNELCELVSRFWKLESVGILDNPDQRDDDECLKLFNNTIYYDSDEKRYVVTLPFKVDPVKVPENYTLAYSRLRNQLKQLQQNPSYLERYHAVIEDQLQRGIIERVPAEDVHKPCHYLSHHGVLKRNDKDLKIRCVYDGSAKLKGSVSLNDTLYRGPVLLPNLVGILILSRLCEILISSDIEKAFLMVGLNQSSRDYTRFLWLKNSTGSLCPQNLITYRFTRVPFGLFICPDVDIINAVPTMIAQCYKDWSRCTPATKFLSGSLWRTCEKRCQECLGREWGECVEVKAGPCSGGYQCQCKGGKVKNSNPNPNIITCLLGL